MAKRTSWIDSNSVISVGASLSLRLPLCVSLSARVKQVHYSAGGN